ncbi:MAG: N-acetyltransferase [Caulobacteraceae bacterium]|nr:N-acetyltransferase [Caulobacteraceae bacterium]
MALFDWTAIPPGVLVGEGVRLRAPRYGDYGEWAMLRARSRTHLQPWEPTWSADELTRAAYRRRLSLYARDRERGEAFSFFVFRAVDGALCGYVRLFNVRHGVAEMGTLGYWVGAPYARQGLGLAAVRAVVSYAFDQLGLHRVEAACIPDNAASKGLLLRAGFEQEGLARQYLRINGVWRDHLLFGMVRG